MRGRDSLQSKITRAIAVILVLVVLLGGVMSAWPAYLRGRSLKREDARLTEEIARKREEIAKLRECQQRFRTDSSFVEKIARQNHRVFPGELVFIFEERQ